MNAKVSLLLFALAAGAAQANPFFAMDTAVRSLDELGTVKALGYDGIGWKLGSPGEIASAVAKTQQQGLKLFSVYNYQGAVLSRTNLLIDPRLTGAMRALQGTDAVLWLTVESRVFPASSPDGDAIAVPALQELADEAAKFGLRIAIYPHLNTWTERVQDAVRLARKVDRKNLGVTFNLCHCLMAGDEAKIPELLAEAAPHLFVVTINGADSGAARTQWNRLIRPLGEGSYDVGIVLKKLAALQYTGPIGLQGYGVQIPVKDNLTRSMAAWKALGARQ